MKLIAKEEEILSLKAKVHNMLGSNLMQLRYCYAHACPEDKIETGISKLELLLDMLRGDEPFSNKDAETFEELQLIAQSMGLDLQRIGDFPHDKGNQRLVFAAIRESISNTLRHAKGDKLFINMVAGGKNEFVVELSNNGQDPEGIIKEGSGLSSLRAKVERAGGIMEIDYQPKFCLRLKLAATSKNF